MITVAHKVNFINKYPTDVNIYTEKAVNVFIDEFPHEPIPPNSYRIIMLEEPLRGQLFDLVQEFRDNYDYVLTYEDEILTTNPKAILFRCADTWVHGYVPDEKVFDVSTVIGGKVDLRMKGYALRHEIWEKKQFFAIPHKFYLSSNYKLPTADYNNNLVLGKSKTPVFDSMFHIAIENRSMKHYFSEKILDCFQTYTVPIYCGCENIEDYFNIDGIIVAKTADEIINICNSLTEDDYHSRMDAMKENYELAQSRVNYLDQLKDKLIEVIKLLK